MQMSGMYNNKSNYHENLRRVTIGISVIGLFTALSFSQREDATTREITTAAVMGVVSTFSIITLSTKEDYGTSKNEIKKAIIKKDRLNVVYNERFRKQTTRM